MWNYQYRTVIVDKPYKSDLVLTYQKRFIRYKESLFTFLTEDGIPWHNNTAERAIRPFAIQRDVSKSPLYDATTHAYLGDFRERPYYVRVGMRR